MLFSLVKTSKTKHEVFLKPIVGTMQNWHPDNQQDKAQQSPLGNTSIGGWNMCFGVDLWFGFAIFCNQGEPRICLASNPLGPPTVT